MIKKHYYCDWCGIEMKEDEYKRGQITLVPLKKNSVSHEWFYDGNNANFSENICPNCMYRIHQVRVDTRLMNNLEGYEDGE